jgi:RNA polymerase sigma-70 factor, ECF subfamily
VSLALSERATLDGAWIGLCRAGDMAVWRALYQQHLPMVHRVAQRMGVPERDLADVCQEVFLRVHRGLGSFRGEAQFSTWLYRITINEAARSRRSHMVRSTLGALLGREHPPAEPQRPDDDLARLQGKRELARVLDGMKPKQRQVFVLFEIEELPLEQIAEILGCPLETVRSRLRHARADFERLRRQRQATTTAAVTATGDRR